MKWSKSDIFNRHILRLGGFHSLSCFLSSIGKLWADGCGFHSLSCFLSLIGKLWADGCLCDHLVDSGVYAGNTAELMLVGKTLTGMAGGSH